MGHRGSSFDHKRHQNAAFLQNVTKFRSRLWHSLILFTEGTENLPIRKLLRSAIKTTNGASNVCVWQLFRLGATLLLISVHRWLGGVVYVWCSGVYATGRYPVLLLGQSIAAVAQPFALFSTTKLAAVWFPPEQRARANMISSMGQFSRVFNQQVTLHIAPVWLHANIYFRDFGHVRTCTCTSMCYSI